MQNLFIFSTVFLATTILIALYALRTNDMNLLKDALVLMFCAFLGTGVLSVIGAKA